MRAAGHRRIAARNIGNDGCSDGYVASQLRPCMMTTAAIWLDLARPVPCGSGAAAMLRAVRRAQAGAGMRCTSMRLEIQPSIEGDIGLFGENKCFAILW